VASFIHTMKSCFTFLMMIIVVTDCFQSSSPRILASELHTKCGLALVTNNAPKQIPPSRRQDRNTRLQSVARSIPMGSRKNSVFQLTRLKILSIWQSFSRWMALRRRYSIYVLECEHNKFYVGSTTNRKRRMKEHMSPRGGSKWTRIHKPKCMVQEYKRVPSQFYLGKEAQVTAELMLQHGINNVRGAMFSECRNYGTGDVSALTGFLGHYNNLDYNHVRNTLDLQFSKSPRRIQRKQDGCFRCGKLGHWANECPEANSSKNIRGPSLFSESHARIYGTGDNGFSGNSNGNMDRDKQQVRVRLEKESSTSHLTPGRMRRKNDECFLCGKLGHWAIECPDPTKGPSS
jgi:predicted GIY-YIG superfamily endonuclease